MKLRGRISLMGSMIAATLCIGFFVYLYFMIWGMVDEASFLRGDLRAAESRNVGISGAEKMLVDTVEKRRALDSYFVGSDGSVAFIDYVESLGRDSGADLSIKTLNVVPGGANDFKDVLSVQLAVIGSWENVIQMIALLEQSPYQLIISSLQMSRQDTIVGKKTISLWHADIIMQVLKIR